MLGFLMHTLWEGENVAWMVRQTSTSHPATPKSLQYVSMGQENGAIKKKKPKARTWEPENLDMKMTLLPPSCVSMHE
jgi:hypothetical protein